MRLLLLSTLFLALSSCSMPSVGYDINLKISGEFDKACIKKVFFASFPKARARKYTGSPSLLYFGSNPVIDLRGVLKVSESVKLENGLSWSSYSPDELMFSSYFMTSRTSGKLLRALKKNKDAVNYLSNKIYTDLNTFVDRSIKDCGVNVLSREIRCHSFGRNKKYFKCIE